MRIECTVSQNLTRKTLRYRLCEDLAGKSKYDDVLVVEMRTDYFDELRENAFKEAILGTMFHHVSHNIMKNTNENNTFNKIEMGTPKVLDKSEFTVGYVTSKVGAIRAEFQTSLEFSKNEEFDQDIYTVPLFLIEDGEFTDFSKVFESKWLRMPVEVK
jgi:hypothetical protein